MPFILPLAGFAALALAAALCLRRVFSKRFYVWLAALALTVLIAFPTLDILLPLAVRPEGGEALAAKASRAISGTPALFIEIFDLAWLAFLLLLAFVLRGDKTLISSRKSLNEHRYLRSRNRKVDFSKL